MSHSRPNVMNIVTQLITRVLAYPHFVCIACIYVVGNIGVISCVFINYYAALRPSFPKNYYS